MIPVALTHVMEEVHCNRMYAQQLIAQAQQTCGTAQQLQGKTAQVLDDAKQLHLALKLMQHWREYQRQQRREFLNRISYIRVKAPSYSANLQVQ